MTTPDRCTCEHVDVEVGMLRVAEDPLCPTHGDPEGYQKWLESEHDANQPGHISEDSIHTGNYSPEAFTITPAAEDIYVPLHPPAGTMRPVVVQLEGGALIRGYIDEATTKTSVNDDGDTTMTFTLEVAPWAGPDLDYINRLHGHDRG